MSFNDLWDSVERLSRLITLANWGIAATLIVTFVCTVIVIKAGNRKDALTGIEDLRKAEQIANLEHGNLTLRGEVATLETNAASANKDLAVLQKSAADAKATQQRVEIDLAKAKAETAKAVIAQEELHSKNLEISRTLESERLKRLQLQRTVLQRLIPQTGEGEKRNWDSLKPFKGVQVLFQYSPQREPGNFAGGLSAFPINAGWIMLGMNPAAKNEIPDGVAVMAYVGPHGETDMSTPAAQAFVEFLRISGVEEVHLLPARGGKLQPNTVVVRIGQIPDPSRHLE